MDSERARRSGFTIFELVVVIGIIAILGSMAVPSITATLANQRLRDYALEVSSVVNRARSEAIRTGNNFIVFYATDASGASLMDGGGNTVPVLLLDDGRAGTANSNCAIDTGEAIKAVAAEPDISAGVLGSPGNAPSDLGAGVISTGSSFRDPSNNAASWILFRPDGAPLAFDSACATGSLGSGAGAFYMRNGDRTAAVTVSPTGITRIHLFRDAWSQ